MDDFSRMREVQLKEMEQLQRYVERGDWTAARRCVNGIDPAGFEIEGWRDLIRILRWQVDNELEEKSRATIRLLMAELRAEY